MDTLTTLSNDEINISLLIQTFPKAIQLRSRRPACRVDSNQAGHAVPGTVRSPFTFTEWRGK